MEHSIGVGLTVFVQHGREQQAADFYSEAFEARQLRKHRVDGELAGVEMLIGATRVSVAGSNPRREEEPSYGGPFFPKAAGAVSTIIQLTVPDIEASLHRRSWPGRRCATASRPMSRGDGSPRCSIRSAISGC